MLGEIREQRVEIVDRDREVVVAVAEVVRLRAPDVHGQLEVVALAGQAEVDVVRGLEGKAAAALEAEQLVEPDRLLLVANADAGVDDALRHSRESLIVAVQRGDQLAGRRRVAELAQVDPLPGAEGGPAGGDRQRQRGSR